MRASNHPTELVWYAVYGSNLLRSRFELYLQNCPEGRTILGDIPIQIPFRLYFGHESSSRWGSGGVSFVEIRRTNPPPTLGRAYLLTLGQFGCVVGGENARKHAVTIPREVVARKSPTRMLERGWYPVLLPFDTIDGVPVTTLTAPEDPPVARTVPSLQYLETIREGLHETYPKMPDAEIDRYLREAVEASRHLSS